MILILRICMQFYYGEKNILRALDEAEFWKHQEAEHAALIQLVTSNLEEEFVSILKTFEIALNNTYGNIVRYIQSVVRSKGEFSEEIKFEMLEWIKYSVKQSESFVDFLGHLLNDSQAVKNSVPSQTIINHIIRESQYFIGIDQLVLK